jgi:hypothetical protein
MARPQADMDITALDVSPEKRLIAAMLRQAITDAQRKNEWQRDAQRWLLQKEVVCMWLELAMFPGDTDFLYARILEAAHLSPTETR